MFMSRFVDFESLEMFLHKQQVKKNLPIFFLKGRNQ